MGGARDPAGPGEGSGVASLWLLGIGCLLLLLLPFSCVRRPPDGRTHLRVWASLDSPEQTEQLRGLVRRFEERHPELRVAVEAVPPQRRADKYLAAMQAGACGDVLYLHWREVPAFAARESLIPLDDWIRRDRYDVEDFLPSCLDAHRFRSRQVSLPEKGATMLLFYNKKLFREAGLEYPTPDWTIARFAEAARRLTRRDAMGRPVQVGCLPYDATSWIWSMGGDFARGGLTELCFTQPETVRAVEFLSDLRNRWRVTTRNMDSRGRDPTAVDVFESGRVAMAVTGPWELPKYEKIQEFDWDLSLFPRGPAGRQTRYAGMGYGIWAGTRHPEASWTLLQYLVGREAMTALRGTGFTDMPTRRSVLQSVFSRQKAPFRLDLMLRSMDPADAQVRVLPQDERWPEVERLFFEELDSALIGLKSPARAMATAQARAERFLSASEYRAGAVDYAGVLLLPAVIGWLLLRRARRRSGREPD